MESRDGGATDPRSKSHGIASCWPVLVVTVVMVLGVSAPIAGAVAPAPPGSTGDVAAQQTDGTNAQWTDPPGQNEEAQADETVDEEKREAAEEGVDEAFTTLQRQNVSVNQSQRAAAVNGTLAAVAQYQNASVQQIQNASYGAVTGTLLQSQNVSVEQVQNATFGGTSGALSQHQNASATQLQHAAYGATHGAVAQQQNATIEQVQVVAQGAAAGAAHEAGKRDRNESKKKAHPGAIREAAQGAAFGALLQEQEVSIEQRQHAAAGAAEGALSQNQSVSVEQRQSASVKQIQVAAMGAAEGALTINQRQEVTIKQVQAAARGACKGALEQVKQVQKVSITQIQEAAHGAAKGAISQSQSASVTQIQAAATGAAEGVLVQKQVVNIVQIQHAAAGAAKGAAKSAAQHQVVNVRQIQAAAAGAGQGAVVQIQEINIVQIQIIAESAADGALSQYQEANVVQIQSAARGACEGAVALTQRQEITIEQIQVITQRAASDTAATAAQIDIDVDTTIYNYARGAAEDPDDDDRDDDAERLQSLFASTDDDDVFLANPNDVAVTVTLTSEDGAVETSTLAAGESTTLELDRGTYTLTAETGDGRDVELSGRDELTVSIEELQSLNVDVDDRTLTIENPNDERLTVTVLQDGDEVTSFDVPRDWVESQILDPGTYTLTAETEDGESVPVNEEDEFQFNIENQVIELSASVEGQNLTVENPSETTATVTVTPEDGDERTFDVSAGDSVATTLDPGNYSLTGDAEDDREVLIDGQSEFEFTIEPEEPIDLAVTVDDQNVSIENPSETDVNVTATNDTGGDQIIEVPAGESVTESLAPGEYTLTGESDDEREVLLDDESELTIQVVEPPEEFESLNVTVEGQNVTVENPNDVLVTVTANSTDADNRTVDVPPESSVTEQFEPGNYTLTAETEDETSVPVNEETEHEITVEPDEPLATGTLTVEDQTGDGTEFVVANASATVPFVVEVDYETGTATSEVFEADETLDGYVIELDPPIEDDQRVEVTVRAAETNETLANQTIEYDVTEPFANVSVDDQTTDGRLVLVESVNLSEGGFVAIHENSTNGTSDVLGVSQFLAPGEYENVTVELEPALTADTTINATAHRDTDDNEAFDFVTTDGAEDEPYVNETGDPVTSAAALTVETGPEPGIEYVNCTTAQVNGTYDRLGVTLNYYTETGNATSQRVLTADDVPGDRPVDGQTLVTVGETNETTMTEDGVLIVQIADPGAFGDEERSFVTSVNTSSSPTGDENLSAAQPNREACREGVRPEPPTLGVEAVEVQDNETALVNLSYENPNDAPMIPAESLFTSGNVADEPPETLDPGQQFVVVEWTPTSPEEDVVWTLNLSNFDLANVSTAGPTAADVPGLLEPPEETATPTETPTAAPTETDTPTETATETETPTESPTETQTESPSPAPTATPSPTPTETPSPTPTPTATATPTATPTATATATSTPTATPSPNPSAAQVTYVSESAVDQLGNGSIRFELQNTGPTPTTIEQVVVDVERGPYAAIYESDAGDECNRCHEVVFRGSDDGYFEVGDAGDAYPLGTVASLQDTATLEPGTTMTVYMSSFRNPGGQEMDVNGARINVTVRYADGSVAEYTVTPSLQESGS